MKLFCGIIISFLTLLYSFGSVNRAATPPEIGCPDGQGLNALENGDFGSGISNILLSDPGIAPGYVYTATPPPNDGFYTITNNTGPWGSFASNWIDIMDNSLDPNGYMMVVNASFAPGVFYAQEVDVCGSNMYQFSADIINLLEPSLPQEILPNVDFLIDGQVFYSTGNIPQNGQWQNVGFVFTTTAFQTTALIEIRNNAPGGQGNDLALDNIAFFTCGPLVTIDAPEFVCGSQFDSIVATTSGGDYVNPVYQWQRSLDGINWIDIPGAQSLNLDFQLTENMFFRVITADGPVNLNSPNCRVVSEPAFVFYSPEEIYDTLFLCEETTLLIDDSLIVAPGNYDIPLISSFGCDSLLHLVVNPASPYEIERFDSICIGQLYNDMPYTNSTTFSDTFTSIQGCDSIVHTNLYVEHIDLILPMNSTINQGESYRIIGTFSGDIVQFDWSPDTAISCLDCPEVDVNPLFTTQYNLQVRSSIGCVDTASIIVAVTFENNIFIPSVFSPNDDGINDTFFPLTNLNINSILRFNIYNRWGGKVYEINQISPTQTEYSWDGNFNGKQMPEGVYVFEGIFSTLNGETISRKGDLLLLR